MSKEGCPPDEGEDGSTDASNAAVLPKSPTLCETIYDNGGSLQVRHLYVVQHEVSPTVVECALRHRGSVWSLEWFLVEEAADVS